MEPEAPQSLRLDQYVVSQLTELSRSSAAKLIEAGAVTLNGKVQTKAGAKVRPADKVVITYNAKQAAEIPEIDLPVLYEDDDCVVVVKPVGLLTHSKGVFNPEATVATWLSHRIDLKAFESAKRAKLEKIGLTDTAAAQNERLGIVHRLDRATSGVMICAKTPEALSWLQKQFAQRRTKKAYAAVIAGQLENDSAIIDMPIERNPKKPHSFRVGSNGKSAVTAYDVVRVSKNYSLVELRPTTGRTHQLRVHLEQLGHPIVGDELYGGEPAERMYLHAESLEITLPNRSREVFKAPIPEGFTELLEHDN